MKEEIQNLYVMFLIRYYMCTILYYILCEEPKKQLEEIYDRLCLKMKNEIWKCY